jgi:hypothetical protein
MSGYQDVAIYMNCSASGLAFSLISMENASLFS